MSKRTRCRRDVGSRSWSGAEELESRTLLAAISWDGGGDGTSWSDAANWSTNTLPGAADDVTINVGANPTINAPAGTTTIKSLKCHETLTVAGGSTLSLANASTLGGSFELSGTLTGAGKITVIGTFTWKNGSMTGAGAVVIGATGVFNIDNAGGVMQLSKPVSNAGAANWKAGQVVFNGAVFTNVAGHTFTVTAAQSFLGGTGTPLFKNSGTFVKSTGSTATIDGVKFQNFGAVTVGGGVLKLLAGGGHTGDFTVNAGQLRLGGAHVLPVGSDITGLGSLFFEGPVNSAGAIAVGALTFTTGASTMSGSVGASTLNISGGTAIFNSNVSASSGTFGSGTLDGTGNFTVTNNYSWSGGTMKGTGKTVVANGATLTMGSNATKGLRRILNNGGSINWTGGSLQLTGGTINNLAGKTFNASAAANLQGMSGTNKFSNAGVFNKTGASKLTFLAGAASVKFYSSGTVNLQGGRLLLNSGGNSGGAWSLDADSTLELSSTAYLFLATATIGGGGGGGTIDVSAGVHSMKGKINAAKALVLDDGTLAVDGTSSVTDLTIDGGVLDGAGTLTVKGTLSWQVGTMKGTGKTVVAQGGVLQLGGSNAKILSRTLNHGGAGLWFGSSVTMSDGTFNITSTGSMTAFGSGVFVNGTGTNLFTNAGAFTKTNDGTIEFETTFGNTGTITVNEGDVLVKGSVQQVSGSTLTDGTWSINGGTLDLVGKTITTNAAEVTIGGDGVFDAVKSLQSNSGSFAVQTTGAYALTPANGTLVNTGILAVRGNATLNITGKLLLQASSTLSLLVTSKDSFGKLVTTDTMTLGGTFRVTFSGTIGGLEDGDVLILMQSSSRIGQFGEEQIGQLPGLIAEVEYLPDEVRLKISAP